MNTSNIILLARHTTPDIDLKICYGQSDVGVKQSFETEAKVLSNKLKNFNITEIYSSPLKRCVLLAESIQQQYNSLIKVDHRLKEMNFGEWELQNWDDISKDDINTWAKDPFGFRPPKGESFDDLIARSSDFYNDKAPQSTQLIVTHAGIIRAYLVFLLDMDPHEALKFELPFACLCKIDTKEKTIQLIEQ